MKNNALILRLNDQAAEAVNFLFSPDAIDNRIELFEQIIDIMLELASDITPNQDPQAYLHIISSLRFLSKDFTAISASLQQPGDGDPDNPD